jgi:hypothetical protein
MASDNDEIIRPTPERMRRAIGYDELTETQRGGTTRKTGAVRMWTNLEDLRRKHLITDEQFEAGQKYFYDHELAGYSPRVTTRWQEWIQGMAGSPGNLDAAERRVFHQKRWAAANKLLEELGCRKAMHWLIMDNLKPEEIGKRFWGYSGQRAASASARVTAALALQQLAKFYGIVK